MTVVAAGTLERKLKMPSDEEKSVAFSERKLNTLQKL